MHDFPESPRPPSHTRQAAEPPTHAQRAAESALAAADLAIGIGGGAVGFARSMFRLGRPLLDAVISPLTSAVSTVAPVAGRTGQAWPQPWLREVAARGRQDREALTSAVVRLVLARIPGLTTALLNELDLTAVVTERVDVNAVAAQVDVDAIARRADVIAILDRLDPAALTRYLIEELDLPAIIQSSTGSIMSDTLHDVRMQSISADERLSRAVDAMLLRRRPRRTTAPGATGPGATAGDGDGTARATT
jgi:hypothetical protein